MDIGDRRGKRSGRGRAQRGSGTADEARRRRNTAGTGRQADRLFAAPLVRAVGIDFFTRLVDGDIELTNADAAGAKFIVSPGYTPEVGSACKGLDIALLPGVSTGSEIMMAADDGFTFLKLFPATAVGGIPLLKAFSGPFADIAFCPTGGVTAETATQFLALPNVKVVGGSWLTPADAMKSGDWARITELAKAASAIR